MNRSRRHFLRSSLATAGVLVSGRLSSARTEDTSSAATASAPALRVIRFEARDGEELQRTLDRYRGQRVRLQLAAPSTIVCRMREDRIEQELSRHAILVPENVHLDLAGSTLELDLRQNGYGVRLANGACIRGGTIRITHSANKGSQGIWHSAVSVGAAYDDGGTTRKPGRFSAVRDWVMEDLTIDQPFEACAIQLMSEAHHGVIRNIRILDSDKALLGVGMDWGSLGPVTTRDEEIPRMRKLWEQGEILSTHPHDVLVENIQVGKLGRNVDGNDAGVRCSACHNITIKNVHVKSAAAGVAIFGGDFGYEFAPERHRELSHAGYVIDGLVIDNATYYGIAINGSADNVYRSRLKHGYDALRDPVHPGLQSPIIRNCKLRPGSDRAQGMYIASVSNALLENVDVSGFAKGLHVEDWVRGMRFRNVRLAGNRKNLAIEGSVDPPTGLILDGIVQQ